MNKKKVCIIGAGIGGLITSIRLAKLGFEVDLYEKNESLGGKVNQITHNNFRFDTGASLITMPFVFDRFFSDVEELSEDYLHFERLDILCKYFFEDGTIINAFSDTNKFAQEIENNTRDAKEDVLEYLNYCKKIYNLTGELFLFNSFLKSSTFLSKKALQALLQLKSLDTNRSMHSANSSFFNDPKTIQIFDRYATYNGSNPFKAPATLNIIQHVEYNLGGYVCRGGVYEIPRALYRLSQKLDVKVKSGTAIKKICHENRRITGVKVNTEIINYDIVVSNADVQYTYIYLLEDKVSKMSKRYSRLEKSSSAIVFYWGVKKIFPELETHNILFSSNYKNEFNDIFEKKTIAEDPTIYIYISSKFNKSDAPAGCENWFVLVNVPADNNHNWEYLVNETRNKVIRKISNQFNVEIDKFIIFENILNPKLLEEKYSSLNGSIYGISSNNRMAAFLRQQNRSKYYKGLYFCGGSAHPGGGIPLVALSAKITSDLIKKYELESND